MLFSFIWFLSTSLKPILLTFIIILIFNIWNYCLMGRNSLNSSLIDCQEILQQSLVMNDAIFCAMERYCQPLGQQLFLLSFTIGRNSLWVRISNSIQLWNHDVLDLIAKDLKSLVNYHVNKKAKYDILKNHSPIVSSIDNHFYWPQARERGSHTTKALCNNCWYQSTLEEFQMFWTKHVQHRYKFRTN